MFKKLICIFTLAALLVLPARVSAESDLGFSLTDVTTEKNRLFETTLSTDTEVAAFVIKLNFSESTTFKEAKALHEDAMLSVNCEQGQVTVAYLCESGAKGELIEFTFKSSDRSSTIDLSAEQVIDKNAEDLSIFTKGANVTVLSKVKPQNDKTQNEKPLPTFTYNKTNIDIEPKGTFDFTLALCFFSGGVLLSATAVVAFLLGKKSQNKQEDDEHEKNS